VKLNPIGDAREKGKKGKRVEGVMARRRCIDDWKRMVSDGAGVKARILSGDRD
jgi:hypothetical protein